MKALYYDLDVYLDGVDGMNAFLCELLFQVNSKLVSIWSCIKCLGFIAFKKVRKEEH